MALLPCGMVMLTDHVWSKAMGTFDKAILAFAASSRLPRHYLIYQCLLRQWILVCIHHAWQPMAETNALAPLPAPDAATTDACCQLLASAQVPSDGGQESSNAAPPWSDSVAGETAVTLVQRCFGADLSALANVDTLLARQRHAREALKQQLAAADNVVAVALNRAEHVAQDTVATAERLQAARGAAVDRARAMLATDAQTTMGGKTGEARLAAELVQLRGRLRTLQSTADYLRAALLAEDLCAQVRAEAERAPKRALAAFADLTQLRRRIAHHPRLTSHLDEMQRLLWRQLLETLEKRFVRALEEIRWPAPMPYPHSNSMAIKLRTFRRAFADLLVLEEPWAEKLVKEAGIHQTKADTNDAAAEHASSSAARPSPADAHLGDVAGTEHQANSTDHLPTALPIHLMLDPIIVRFRYHFEGKRPTNRLDKPEWYFTHVLSLIQDHAVLLDRECQPLVERAGLAWSAKVATQKLQHDLPKLLEHPGLLSHVIAEAVSFDTDLRDGHGYSVVDGHEWRGTVEVFVGDKTRFKRWLAVEKEFALARYNEIIETKGAWELQMDESLLGGHHDSIGSDAAIEENRGDDEARPTQSADILVNLIEVVTERYRSLPRVAHRIRFLLEIQIELLDRYRTEIASKADAFEHTRFGAFSVVQRQAREQVAGLAGLKLLSRWLESLLYVRSAMRDWAEDVFFLELWRNINQHSASAKPSPRVDSFAAASTAKEIPSDTTGGEEDEEDDEDEATVFDDVIDCYTKLAERLQGMIARCIGQEITYELRLYAQKRGWPAATETMLQQADEIPDNLEEVASSRHGAALISSGLSPELARPLSMYGQYVAYINDNLPRRVFTSVFRATAGIVDEWLWSRLVLVQQFGDAGARRLVLDFEQGVASIGHGLVRQPQCYYRRMRDVVALFKLPTERQVRAAKDGQVDETDTNSITVEETGRRLRKAQQDGELESAQHLMERLGVFSLELDEAAEVAERRVTALDAKLLF
ncbi:TIP-1 family-domain-containing protein [Thamnocephalis sphaerospora]|uniref:TIP-1 family-domain-containing protein n=1 Tax=Thamnocephalis sphaerospora TaxID=78915 RepID=A0A4P9XKX8_9FUNG|nr:TIP-1 family-domain-containing protein [Thamnocephalis sphaerospora]|eukprot:RKP06483.1 TIP-1 family-domain-containing protein [Thamnocephalis sphaerospora]